eukprot:1123792-Pyramimonas_sp.AAC.1
MAMACSIWPRCSIAPAGAATSSRGSGARILRGRTSPIPPGCARLGRASGRPSGRSAARRTSAPPADARRRPRCGRESTGSR